ncbi:protein BOLA4, chloroplastic/mitochondrial isoform X1 [Ananas comosus]|uniref:Protein BOLA4, chloroplastic/mitochondrial isoform X1 n=1 Tax=Ananas comosus TaxID=4615 RepID=A0A6P5EJV1_ANACO|nr:protein BOLA4, chloroplastic/mitochondrial isoform X1 [Ananas comosus]
MRAPAALAMRPSSYSFFSSSSSYYYPLASLFHLYPARQSSSAAAAAPSLRLAASPSSSSSSSFSSSSFRGRRVLLPSPPPFLVRRLCSVRATQVSDSGSINSPMMQAMENKIKEQLEADVVIVKDAYGDGRHVSIDVVSKAFEGQSAVNRQRMVYKAIWEELQSTVHAVDQMTTKTPAEAAADN